MMANRFDFPNLPYGKICNIAVVGTSGSGKSSFINAVRRLSREDVGAAPVGIHEHSRQPIGYVDPRDENLIFWEIPPKNMSPYSVLQNDIEINMVEFDLILIVTCNSFTEQDAWLARQVTCTTKPVYLIRSMTEMDVCNDKCSHPETHDTMKLLEIIREYLTKELESQNLHIPVFLIDSYKTDIYDFPELADKLQRKEECLAVAVIYNKGVTGDEGGGPKNTPRILEGPIETAKDVYTRIAAEIKSQFIKKGIEGIKEHIVENLDRWKNVEVNIAIAGASGSGKSSFINAIRSLTADDEGAAAVGCTETTMEPKPYEHPKNKNFRLWDLPGFGTLKFKKEEYLSMIDFSKFDFVMIMSSERFTENDAWLAKEMKRMQKTYFFVRTKIHRDVKNNKESHPRSHDKTAVLAEIRESCHSHLKKNGLPPERVFLIDNMKTNAYPDFERLELCLIAECTDQQRDMITFSLSNVTKEVNREKKRRLEARVPFIALLFGFKFLVSDLRRLLHDEVALYKSQFSLNPSSLKHDAHVSNISDHTVEEIQMQADKESDEISQVEKEMYSLARFIPIVGQVKVGKACARYLRDSLNMISDVAIKASDEMVKNLKAVNI